MGGQPDLGKVALADAPVDSIETDGVRFAVHVDVRRPCPCSACGLRHPVVMDDGETGGSRGTGWPRITAMITRCDPHNNH